MSQDPVSVGTEPAIHLFVFRKTLKIRQGWSQDGGRTKAFLNVSFDLGQVERKILHFDRGVFVYEIRILPGNVIEGVKVVELSKGKIYENSDPQMFPLAGVSFASGVTVRFEVLPKAEFWAVHEAPVMEALAGRYTDVADAERDYVAMNKRAVLVEAREELQKLAVQGCTVKGAVVADRVVLGIWPAEERPFRLYRGCTILLRGAKWFLPAKAQSYPVPGMKGASEWTAVVTESSMKWKQLLSAPIHALLRNKVEPWKVPRINEEHVKILPLLNPAIEEVSVQASEFDNICRAFELQDAGLSASHRLGSLFLPHSPMITTYHPVPLPDKPGKLIPASWGLDDLQKQAVIQIVEHRLSLVVGSPGTGKTRTAAAIAAFVSSILPAGKAGYAKVAILGPTHAAGEAVINQLAPFFRSFGLQPRFLHLRSWGETEARLFAGKESLHDDMGRMLLLANHDKPSFAAFSEGVEAIRKSGTASGYTDMRRFSAQRSALVEEMMRHVDIVVTTPVNVSEMLRRRFNPEYLVFDEANAYRDTEIFHVLAKLPGASRMLFLGDCRQMWPVAFTKDGQSAWAESAFERLTRKPYKRTVLNQQFRAHQALYQPTSLIYNDGQEVKSAHCTSPFAKRFAGNATITISHKGRAWALKDMVGFLHIRSPTSQDTDGSLMNAGEASLGLALAMQLIASGVKDVLIMSAYRAQVATASNLLASRWPNAPIVPRIQTVEASQGSEAAATIILVTRNMGAASVLRTSKRLNVMTSRARHFQYFVGSWDWVTGRELRQGARHLGDLFQLLEKNFPNFVIGR
ncbi:hypothetical protein BO70DRAFT_371752 [Aspergillus heteromorphus CBS 117.55]|uniref:DNA2/NAM7 helicase-like C-terminal domain-containing protein n=1 Tax=Aspergillus heteromorphus CBS 117.55 TaxID=1448321 RepID=A0A317W280_9EURO|nr:uncharacterized protein BO70DRAFT_371752 [Aspergillus heteromorphus CBS 117.55]PWY79701.1 hypothetical protein BO70DRAFT_371752 [Aspergillus heteromorphus CBS 117.55]